MSLQLSTNPARTSKAPPSSQQNRRPTQATQRHRQIVRLRRGSLEHTQEGQFSRDGALVVGGNARHVITWSTADWTRLHDLPSGPDYVATIAVDAARDLVLIGGPKAARLVILSTGQEIAKAGQGYTNFAAFNRPGTLLLDYAGSGFGVWGTDGTKFCEEPNLGSNVVALSPNDEWVAMSTGHKGTDVMLWKLKTILTACGAPSPTERTDRRSVDGGAAPGNR